MLKAIAMIGLTLAGICTASIGFAQGRSYGDSDWNTQLVDGCGLPQPNSVQYVEVGGDQKLRFTLASGDKGRCSNDDRARHRAPYWERAELSQHDLLQLGHRYRISAELQFTKGFEGERETFMQIHAWARDCTQAYPPVMMKFHKGKLRIEPMRAVSKRAPGRHRNLLRQRVTIQSLYGTPTRLTLDYDTSTAPARLSVFMGERQILNNAPVEIAACGKPHLKLGIYRPGGKGSGPSQVIVDDVRITKVK